MLAALASPRRQAILRLVWHEERTAGDIHRALGDVTFGAVSLQLGILREAGLVVQRADRQRRFYRARPEVAGALRATLETMWDDALWRLTLQAELEATRRGPRARPRKSGSRRRDAR